MKKTTLITTMALAACLIGSPSQTFAKDTGMDLVRQLNDAFVNVSDQASASVVVIRVATKPGKAPFGMDEDNPFYDYFRRFFGEQGQPEQRQPRRRQQSNEPVYSGQGSGFIIRADGYIMTNRHVVEDADKVKVKLKDGREFDAVVQGMDPQSDIAVLKVDATGLPVSKLGDSSKTRVGEFAIAIGAPFDLDYTVTIGHISAKGRGHIVPDMAMVQDFIQTDASINPGNSGGPLVNINGEVIGINTMIRGMNTGIGFAVPMNIARDVADRIMTEGKFANSYIGVRIQALSETPDLKDMVKGVKEGVVVRAIDADGPAAKSDLKPSDVITAVDGKSVASSLDLKNEIRFKKPGKDVNLSVVRDGKNLTVKVKPEVWQEEARFASMRSRGTPSTGADGLGFSVKPLTSDIADQLDLKANSGVLVSEVERDSVAESVGIKPGDVITEINRKPVTNLREFREATKGADLKKGVIVNLVSGGSARFEVLKDKGE